MAARQGIAAEFARRGYEPDAAQRAAIEKLDALRARLIDAEKRRDAPLTRARRLLRAKPKDAAVRGLYLWGGVGRGKTLLLDFFHASLPFERKRRSHFHRFMQDVHAQLKAHAKEADPLALVADRYATELRVLCFDELYVSDIADAMILGKLFGALIERGVTLVFTSNLPPSGLYREGLQRQRFLPAIALLEKHTEVLTVNGPADYRLRQLGEASLYLDSSDPATPRELQRLFAIFADTEGTSPGSIEVAARSIPIVRDSDTAAWFTFDALCEGPRGQADYIEISRDYACVVLQDVPVLDESRENAARRFIALVDELYDRGVDLVISAAAPIDRLYRGTRLTFEFARTASRLIEMQSEDYRAREHLA